MEVIFIECLLRLPDLLAKKASIDEISAKLKTLEAMHESVQTSLKESQANEIKLKKELEAKHAQAIAELEKKLKASDDKVQTLSSQLKSSEAEAKVIDDIVFRKLCCYLDSVLLEVSQ